MKKVTKLIDYKNMLLKRAGDLRVSRGLIDEDADAEDVMFELECSWDIEPEHLDLGFVMRKNATPDLIYLEGQFCQFVQRIEKDGKETLEIPEKDTPLHQCILVEYTGAYEAFYENGSLEITADFKDGFLDGRFIHYSTSFQKIREYGFWGGEKHGLATLYHPDGRLISVTPWYQGSRDGDVLRYNGELNQKITTYSYKEGKIYEISK
ncbi:hypothetical protein N9O22_01030 [Gammaproteobacteria bacterium]|nr:hypothetical protein [Gammaproteobacteria bacterium]